MFSYNKAKHQRKWSSMLTQKSKSKTKKTNQREKILILMEL